MKIVASEPAHFHIPSGMDLGEAFAFDPAYFEPECVRPALVVPGWVRTKHLMLGPRISSGALTFVYYSFCSIYH